MKASVQALFPPLILAGGILAATAISLLTTESRWLALAAPLALALSVVLARVSRRRASGQQPACGRTTLVIASAQFVIGAALALIDPASLPLFLPLLGATSLGVLDDPRRCAVRRVHAGRAA
jgi:hypothetical protein